MKVKIYAPVLTMSQIEALSPEEIKELTQQVAPPGYDLPAYFFADTSEGKFEFARQIPVISIPKLPDEA